MDAKPLTAIAVVALLAVAGIVLFINSETTGMISGQQTPYGWVYGQYPRFDHNPCEAVMQCADGGIAMPVAMTRYTNQVYCQCPKHTVPYYEAPAYVKLER